MAQTERVLVVSSGDQQTQQLEGTMSVMREQNIVPVVFSVQAVIETLPGADFAAASIDALKRLVAEGELEAIIVVAGDDELGTATEAIARQAAAETGVPLWRPTPTATEAADRTIGDHVFRVVDLPKAKIAYHRTFGYWLATVGTGVLSIAVTAAGTFSYLSTPPIGLLLATLALWGTLLGSRLMFDYRTPSVVAGIATTLTLLVLAVDPFSSGAGTGSVLVPSNAFGWIWIAVVAIGSFATLTLPDLRAARASRLDVREGATP